MCTMRTAFHAGRPARERRTISRKTSDAAWFQGRMQDVFKKRQKQHWKIATQQHGWKNGRTARKVDLCCHTLLFGPSLPILLLPLPQWEAIAHREACTDGIIDHQHQPLTNSQLKVVQVTRNLSSFIHSFVGTTKDQQASDMLHPIYAINIHSDASQKLIHVHNKTGTCMIKNIRRILEFEKHSNVVKCPGLFRPTEVQ